MIFKITYYQNRLRKTYKSLTRWIRRRKNLTDAKNLPLTGTLDLAG